MFMYTNIYTEREGGGRERGREKGRKREKREIL